jgi:LAO/AO transport system kinase
MNETDADDLVAGVLDGDHRALARTITKIENRALGHRDLVSSLHAHTGDAKIVGVTGSPGAGKSTLVDKLATRYRDRGLTVGVIAVDPSSPYSGGAVLGDRIRMASNIGDMDVFFRSMSARGQLGGLSTATGDAIKALDAFGKDRIIVETVGAGQNEVDVVRTADTVVVLVQPGGGDDVQMLKAGILEIGDVFVVNKADMDGVRTTVSDLREMLHMRDGTTAVDAGHHGAGTAVGNNGETTGADRGWEPRIVETVATEGDGVDDLIDILTDHYDHLRTSGELDRRERARHTEEIRRLLRSAAAELLEDELDRHGGIDALVDEVQARETDPYTVVDRVLDPLVDRIERSED